MRRSRRWLRVAVGIVFLRWRLVCCFALCGSFGRWVEHLHGRRLSVALWGCFGASRVLSVVVFSRRGSYGFKFAPCGVLSGWGGMFSRGGRSRRLWGVLWASVALLVLALNDCRQ